MSTCAPTCLYVPVFTHLPVRVCLHVSGSVCAHVYLCVCLHDPHACLCVSVHIPGPPRRPEHLQATLPHRPTGQATLPHRPTGQATLLHGPAGLATLLHGPAGLASQYGREQACLWEEEMASLAKPVQVAQVCGTHGHAHGGLGRGRLQAPHPFLQSWPCCPGQTPPGPPGQWADGSLPQGGHQVTGMGQASWTGSLQGGRGGAELESSGLRGGVVSSRTQSSSETLAQCERP